RRPRPRRAGAAPGGAHRAGMSAESGIPTFRDTQTGLWERYSPEQLATEDAFLADPDLVWSWYRWRTRMVRARRPNPGHD
ncbi:NAD-dependent deacylase, partial [Micrococcus endophyticus]